MAKILYHIIHKASELARGFTSQEANAYRRTIGLNLVKNGPPVGVGSLKNVAKSTFKYSANLPEYVSTKINSFEEAAAKRLESLKKAFPDKYK